MPIKKRGNAWQVDVAHKGQRVRISCPTYEEALAREAQYKADILAGKPLVAPEKAPGPRSGDTIGRAFDLACQHWRGTKAAAKLQRTAKEWCDRLGWTFPLTNLSTEKIASLVEQMTKEGNSGATINRKVAALSVMLREARDRGLSVPLVKLPRKKEYQGRLRYFSDFEVWDMIEFFSDDDPMMRDLVILAVDTGFRLGELLNLRAKDYNPATGKLTAWETKGNKARSVPLTGAAKAAVKRRSVDPLTPLFQGLLDRTVRKKIAAWKAYRDLPKDDEACFHTLRHTCATRLVTKGVPLITVQRWMGHSDIKTTMRYAHLAPEAFDGAVQALEDY